MVLALATNTVGKRQIRTGKVGYHHGNLRAALISSGLGVLQQEGRQKLTLRRLAQLNGVSQPASAHHFRDKEGVEIAIAAECFRELQRWQLAQLPQVGVEPRDRLRAMLTAYVDFAEMHPHYFELMFDGRLLRSSRSHDLKSDSLAAFNLLALVVGDCLRPYGVDSGAVQEATVAAWAFAHGLCAIQLGFQIPLSVLSRESVSELRNGTIERFVEGLGAYAPR